MSDAMAPYTIYVIIPVVKRPDLSQWLKNIFNKNINGKKVINGNGN